MDIFLRTSEFILLTYILLYSLLKLRKDKIKDENHFDLLIIRGIGWRLLMFGIMLYNLCIGKFTFIVIWDFIKNLWKV